MLMNQTTQLNNQHILNNEFQMKNQNVPNIEWIAPTRSKKKKTEEEEKKIEKFRRCRCSSLFRANDEHPQF